MYKTIISAVFFLLLASGEAMAVCSSYPYTLTNGTTADATQVMADLNCAALTSGATIDTPTITGTATVANISANTSLSGWGGALSGNVIEMPGAVYLTAYNDPATVVSLYLGANNYYDGSNFKYKTTDSATYYQQYRGTHIWYGAPSGAAGSIIAFNEYARLGSDGSFLVGTTTNGGWSGNFKIEARNGTGTSAISAYSTGTTGSALVARVETATVPRLLDLYYGASNQAFVNTNGAGGTMWNAAASFAVQSGGSGGVQLTSGATSWAAISDERVKNWNVIQHDYRAAIRKLWVGEYDRYKDFSKTGTPTRDFGIRAQQAFQVLPENLRDRVIHPGQKEADFWTVSSEPFGFLSLWGVKDLYSSAEKQSIQTSALEKKLTFFIQEISLLKTANDNQAAKVTKLESEISTLERRVNVRTATK